MADTLMIQGTMSSAGKSLLTAGLCRVFRQDGYRVAPFKSQNMSSFFHTTPEGLVMSRAQVVQAEAAGVPPDVRMNPILLRPVSNMGSEVFVVGRPRGQMKAAAYFAYKPRLIADIMEAFDSLARENHIIVIEGAGSPAEINLKENDIVNMGLAKMTKSPVLLVGDIDRGGVFAQLYGTLALLTQTERGLVKGLVINKFRGDVGLLRPGLDMMEQLSGKPILGVLPMLDVDIEEEDSQSEQLKQGTAPRMADDRDQAAACRAYREKQYDTLARAVRESLDMEAVYRILKSGIGA